MGICEEMTMTSWDGLALDGKLDLPEAGRPRALICFVNGSGPNTCDDHREGGGLCFDFYGLLADYFTQGGAAFFRTATRGVTPAAEPPFFCAVDEEAYRTYLPQNVVRDMEDWLRLLSADPRLAGAPVWLLGWSEGTILAPLVARRGAVRVDGLLLAGYANDGLWDILHWQETGGAAMLFYRRHFDADGDGRVSRAEFEGGPEAIRAWLRDQEGVGFDDLDADGDGFIDKADLAALEAEPYAQILAAIRRGDDGWLGEHYPVRLTSGWFLAHRELLPNSQVLPGLDLPIHIFQGVWDGSTPVEGACAIRERFGALGKTNLTVGIYDQEDHNLGVAEWAAGGGPARAVEDMLRAVLAGSGLL